MLMKRNKSWVILPGSCVPLIRGRVGPINLGLLSSATFLWGSKSDASGASVCLDVSSNYGNMIGPQVWLWPMEWMVQNSISIEDITLEPAAGSLGGGSWTLFWTWKSPIPFLLLHSAWKHSADPKRQDFNALEPILLFQVTSLLGLFSFY